MGKTLVAIYDRISQKRTLFLVLVFLWVAAAALFSTRLKVDQDIYSALPMDQEVAEYRDLLSTLGGSERVMLTFSVDKEQDLRMAINAAIKARDSLTTSYSDSYELAVGTPSVGEFQDFKSWLIQNLPYYADPVGVERLGTCDSLFVDSLVGALRMALASPFGAMRNSTIQTDPAELLAPLVERLTAMTDLGSGMSEEGIMTATNGTTAMLVLDPAAHLGKEQLNSLKALGESAAGSSNVRSALFGGPVIALANEQRIKQDSRLTLTIAIVAILLLLWWYYRQPYMPLLFILPLVFAALSTIAVLSLLGMTISAIALGTGAIMVGITLDYCFHFFTHLKESRSVKNTLRSVSTPLLLGCLTTVLAFLGLRWLEPKILRDLGLIAALMLSFAAFFVLVALPHFLPRQLFATTDQVDESEASEHRRPLISKALGGLLMVLITLLLIPFISHVSFSSDPEDLSYMPDELIEVRNAVFGTENDLQTVFLKGMGDDMDQRKYALELAVNDLRADPRLHLPVLSSTDLFPSEATMRGRMLRWEHAFHEQRIVQLRRWFSKAANAHGLKSNAFEPFLTSLSAKFTAPSIDGSPISTGMLAGALKQGSDGVAMLRADANTILRLGEDIGAGKSVRMLHRGVVSDHISALIGRDLNRILWFTSGLVFLILLITYGRIELAVITFLPMALSWVWILGICGLFGITFNMVNIIVVTFIFGLGDDYCIFRTEGVLEDYRTGHGHDRAVRHGIALSVTTTIIGTGVLIFAEHPALRSIALLSIIGMICILITSLALQPLLLRAMITGRTESGHPPFTASSLFISMFAFCYFFLGCLVLLFLSFILIPVGEKRKRGILRKAIQWCCGSLVYIMVNTKKDINDFASDVDAGPKMVITNHNSFIDILAMLMISPRTVMMTNRWVWNSPFFGRAVRAVGSLRSEDDVETNIAQAIVLKDAYDSVIIFPEGTRSRTGKIGRFHKGAFYLQEHLGLPIVPVLLHGFEEAMPKGDWMLKNAKLTMRTLPAISAEDAKFGRGYRERTKLISRYFKSEHSKLKKAIEVPSYFHQRLMQNFIYKGPTLEWHTRIKAKMDHLTHDRIHALIPEDARVMDLGCGHGMLSFLLHWSAPQRIIIGVDHDEEKIALAQHCFGKGENLTFVHSSVMGEMPPAVDHYILKDLLHYLTPTAQTELLHGIASHLPAHGSIIIRDGFVDQHTHQRTRNIERFSTRIGFNKTAGALHFMEHAFIEAIAKEHGLSVQWWEPERDSSDQLVRLSHE